LGVEKITIRFSDVFGEETASDIFVNRGPGREEVNAGSSDISGPCNGLGPRSGGEVEGEDCEEVFKSGVEIFWMAFLDVHEVEVIVCEDGGEFGADHQAVAMADEDRFHFSEFLDWFGDGLLHQF